MKSFELKAQDYYGDVVINKGLMGKAGFGARSIPVYVGEWIISQFADGNTLAADGREEIVRIVSDYLPQKADKNVLLNRLKEQEEVRILDDFRVHVNLAKNTHELSIPILDANSEMVQKGIVDDNPMLLKTGMWGLGTLQYVPPDGEDVKKGQIWMVDFKPFQTPGVDLEYYKECRSQFTLAEWTDLLVSSCQVNPDCLEPQQKMLLLTRIIPLVQPRVNIAELAPKGTGKSFVFDNISRYAAVIPGGKLSAPALFYNSASKRIGLIPRYDVVVVDEVQKIQTDSAGEAMAGLKMYLESGRYRRSTGDMGTSEAGFVLLGNITLDTDRYPLYVTDGIFRELPAALQESAFVDRVHGLLEGWLMPRITKDTPSRFLGFKGDFFSEVLHELRVDLQYADYVSHCMHLPECEDMRDNKAIGRLAEGYLKLLFPDLKVTESEFVEWCVNPAVRMRQQIRDELAKLDLEYKWVTIKSEQPDAFQLSHPQTKPEPVVGPERGARPTEGEVAEFHKYQLLQEVTAGGMAEAYIALDSETNEKVFVKRVELGSSDVAALNREVGIYAQLQFLESPNLLKIREVDRDDKYFFIVTDYAEGGDLESYVAERQHVNWTAEEAKAIALQIAEGLRELHSQKIVHRDIKPENVLLAGGYWKLADFGISKNLERISTIKTQGGKGSRGYAPPEQWKLGTAASPSADVYSFGKIVVFLLTGATDVDAVIDPDWQEFVRSCTRQLPGDRPPIETVLESLSAIPT